MLIQFGEILKCLLEGMEGKTIPIDENLVEEN